jgi:hypothetical protein
MRVPPLQMRRLRWPASVLCSDAGRFVLRSAAGSPRRSKDDLLYGKTRRLGSRRAFSLPAQRHGLILAVDDA